ncbi:MAG: hypothetical protein M5R42_07970 [Rhodocyclaceae bacterium]|nr:hypothetical protein [Rhodocyclaceae bacterium]
MRTSVAAAELTQHYPGIVLPAKPAVVIPSLLEQPHEYWRERILQHNHELAAVRAEVKRRQALIARSQAEEMPDPTVGVRHASEAGGSERVTGVYGASPCRDGRAPPRPRAPARRWTWRCRRRRPCCAS